MAITIVVAFAAVFLVLVVFVAPLYDIMSDDISMVRSYAICGSSAESCESQLSSIVVLAAILFQHTTEHDPYRFAFVL